MTDIVEMLMAGRSWEVQAAEEITRLREEVESYKITERTLCNALAASQARERVLRDKLKRYPQLAYNTGFFHLQEFFDEILATPTNDTALRNHVADEMVKMEGVGKIISVSDYAERYRKGEV